MTVHNPALPSPLSACALKVLIADDEPLVRRDLRRLLAMHDDVTIIGEATDGHEVLASVAEHAPNVILLDIQMPSMDGLSALLAVADPLPEVVFVTAHAEYALRAFELDAVDYLLKPFNAARLSMAMQKVRRRLGQASGRAADDGRTSSDASLSDADPQRRMLQRIPVRERGRIRYVPVLSIRWIEAADNYVLLHVEGVRHVFRSTLSALTGVLDPARFVRVHRSAVVNLDYISEVEPMFKGDAIIILVDGTRIPLGRRYREQFRQRMQLG